jgi:hypothetical protein
MDTDSLNPFNQALLPSYFSSAAFSAVSFYEAISLHRNEEIYDLALD